jgi:hypothetical protein
MAIDTTDINTTEVEEPKEITSSVAPSPKLITFDDSLLDIYYSEYGRDYPGEKPGNLNRVQEAMARDVSRYLLEEDVEKKQSLEYKLPDGSLDYEGYYFDLKNTLIGEGENDVAGDYGILDTFTNLNNLSEAGSSKANALVRGAVQGFTGFTTGIAAAKIAGNVLSATPLPHTQVAGKVLQAGSFLAGSLTGEVFLGPIVREQIFGEDIDPRTLIPEDRATYNRYFESGAIAPYAIGAPFMMPTRKMGTYSALRAISDDLPVTYQAMLSGPAGNQTFNAYLRSMGVDPSNPFTQKYIQQIINNPEYKESVTSRIVNSMEDALVRGRQAYTPGTPGSKALYAAEASTIPLTGYFVGKAEEEAPGEALPYAGAVVSGALAPHLSTMAIFSKVIPSVQQFFKDFRAKDLTLSKDLLRPGRTARQERLAIQQLLESYEKTGEDPLRAADEIEKIFIDPETGKVRQEFREIFKTGDGEIGPILSSSSLNEDNVALAALENFIFKSGAEASVRGKAFKNALAMQFGVLQSLRKTAEANAVLDDAGNIVEGSLDKNTREMLKAANELEQNMYASAFNEYRKQRVDNLALAIKQVYRNDAERGNKVLSEKLMDLLEKEDAMFKGIINRAYSRVEPEGDGILTTYNRYTTDENGETVVSRTSNIPNHISTLVDLIDGNIGDALSNLQIDSLKTNSPAFLALAKEAVDILKKDGRKPSDKLLRAAGKPAAADDAAEEAVEAVEEVTEEAVEPLVVEKTVEDLKGDRSVVLRELRKLTTDVPSAARVISFLDRAFLDDIDSYDKGYSKAYRYASNVAAGYYEGLRRTFGGDVVRTNKDGRQIIDPSLIVSQLIRGGDDPVDAKFMKLSESTDQLKKTYQQELEMQDGPITFKDPVTKKTIELTANDVDSIGNDMDGTLRFVLLDLLKKTQRSAESRVGATQESINKAEIQALRKYQEDNPRLMEQFPEISRTIDELEPSYSAFDIFSQRLASLEEERTGSTIVKQLLNVESPVLALNKALNSSNPTKELNKLLGLTKFYKPRTKKGIEVAGKPTSQLRWERSFEKRGEKVPEILENGTRADLESGILSLVLEAAIQKSGNLAVEEFNPGAFIQFLFGKIPNAAKEDATLMKYLVDNKLISEKDATRLKIATDRIVAGMVGAADTDAFDPLAVNQSLLADLFIRIGGARAASAVGRMIPGPAGDSGLVIAGFGPRLADAIMNKIPYLQRAQALEKIITDPELLVMALRTPRDAKEADNLLKSFTQRLKETGVAVVASTVARTGLRTVPRTTAGVGRSQGTEDRELALIDTQFQRKIDALNLEIAPLKAHAQNAKDPNTKAVIEMQNAPGIKRLEDQIEKLKMQRMQSMYRLKDRERQQQQPRPEVVVPQQQPRPTARPLQTSMTPPAPQSGRVNPQTAARLSAAFPEDEILAMASPAKSGIGSLMG